MSINGSRTVDDFHKRLGAILWEYCGMVKTNAGLDTARSLVRELRAEFWEDAMIPGKARDLNQSLERAGRIADYLELAELLVIDARHRQESCGAHFHEAFQTDEHEALRDDEHFGYVAAWESTGVDADPALHKEPLTFEHVQPAHRSYT